MKRHPIIAARLALILLAAVWLARPSDAVAQPTGPADRIELVIQCSAARPHPGEMVLLTVRTTLFGKRVALDDLKLPTLENFAWIQLTPDRWFSTEVDGMQALRSERAVALFPTKSGLLTIDPFVHRLTVTDDNNRRNAMDLQSMPVQVDVQAWPAATGGEDDSGSPWLPAKSLTVTDKWEPDSNRIRADGTAERTVIIEAKGLTADRLPPAPKLRSPGVITFAHPEERQTLISPTGPIARAVYRWDIRPATRYAATLQAVPIAWFDTTTRKMRQATLPARRVAFARAEGDNSVNGLSQGLASSPHSIACLSGLAAFVVALGLLLSRPGQEVARSPAFARLQAWLKIRPLRRAIQSGDAYRFRAAVCQLARHDPERSRQWLGVEPVQAGLAALDAHLFGAGKSKPPDLTAIAAAIRDAWLRLERDAADPIALLDVSASSEEDQTANLTVSAKRAATIFRGWL